MPTTIPLLLPPKNRTHESVKQEYRNKAIDDSFSLLITKVEQKKKWIYHHERQHPYSSNHLNNQCSMQNSKKIFTRFLTVMSCTFQKIKPVFIVSLLFIIIIIIIRSDGMFLQITMYFLMLVDGSISELNAMKTQPQEWTAIVIFEE
jgi:hypothetical protein